MVPFLSIDKRRVHKGRRVRKVKVCIRNSYYRTFYIEIQNAWLDSRQQSSLVRECPDSNLMRWKTRIKKWIRQCHVQMHRNVVSFASKWHVCVWKIVKSKMPTFSMYDWERRILRLTIVMCFGPFSHIFFQGEFDARYLYCNENNFIWFTFLASKISMDYQLKMHDE